jgi:aldehyde:ferredoxin oxidoreductase
MLFCESINIGVDTIEMGVAIGVAMDAGLIPFGDGKGAIRLVRDEVALGKKVFSAERDFNRRAGFSAARGRLPHFFYTDPVAPHNLTFQVSDEELDRVFDWE